MRDYLVSLRACLEGRRHDSLDALRRLRRAVDAEARYCVARTYAALDEPELALRDLTDAVDGGFVCHDTFTQDPWLAPLRTDARFTALLERARDRSIRAAAAFAAAGGHRVLGA